MKAIVRLLCVLLLLSATACSTLGHAQRERAAGIAVSARDAAVDCTGEDRCAQPSELHALGAAALVQSQAAPDGRPRHFVLILDEGGDALLARINLIRAATGNIDLQTYIFDKDDSARLVIDELLAAARRGVRVRVLIDQLSAIADLQMLAALAGAHENLELRVYNPTFGEAISSYLDYAASVICCFRRFNQRMHNKLLVVDGTVAIAGGRNYQDDYYDWDTEYNFRDRDLLVAGPVVHAMERNFQQYWDAPLSVPAERLDDVARLLLEHGVPAMPPAVPRRPDRVEAMSSAASDEALVRERLVHRTFPVGEVAYLADLPGKHDEDAVQGEGGAGAPGLAELLAGAQREILLQTPYLVLSDSALALFHELREQPEPPRVVVSTNSLAATDNPIVYALTYKYKRRHVRELGFDLFEYKPFPADPPVDPALGAWQPGDPFVPAPGIARSEVPGSLGSAAGGSRAAGVDDGRVEEKLRTETRPSLLRTSAPANRPVPVHGDGPRMGLHAKSMVIDRRVGVVGTHNFDPRSEKYNTEAVLVIDDPVFAQALAESIERDIEPGNSWTVAPREKPPVLSGLTYSMGKVLEVSPILDVWPWRYATNYEFRPGPDCPAPLPRSDPDFLRCYEPVGDFPEVTLGPKSVVTRMLTAFGAGLVPIL